MSEQEFSVRQYEKKYQTGYGLVYPESHIIRLHKQILDWELGLRSGNVFDFGCGSGAHLKYFSEQGFAPFGCDTSQTAIKRCKKILPRWSKNFFVTPVKPDLTKFLRPCSLDVFLSNQVFYYLSDAEIRNVTNQAHMLLRPGGVFIATMMSHTCWYTRYIVGAKDGFKRIEMGTPRQKETMFINFKSEKSLPALFKPFQKLHLGSYGSHIREEEGSTDHWIYVGNKR